MVKGRPQLGGLQYAIILLTIVTAVIHFTLLFPDVVFILNGLGYLTLLAALYLPISQLAGYRNVVRWALMAYTALTIILWVLIGSGSPLTSTPPNPLAYVDKLVEVMLLALLWIESQRATA